MTKYGWTLLHEAVLHDNMELAELLINNGIDINTLYNSKGTPLDVAIKSNNPKLVELLRIHGAKSGSEIENNPDIQIAESNKYLGVTPQDWKIYENKQTSFQISYPTDWGVIESMSRDGVTLIGEGVIVDAEGRIIERDRIESGVQVRPSLEQIFKKYIYGMEISQTLNGKAGLASFMQTSFLGNNNKWTWLLVAINGDCKYVVKASCDAEKREATESFVEKIFNSVFITSTVSATDVYNFRLKHSKVPWDAEPLAKSYYEQGMKQVEAGLIDKAESSFIKSIELASNQAAPRTRLSTLYIFQDRWDEATSQARAAFYLYPQGAFTHYLMGVCYYNASQTERAIKYLMSALALDPTFSSARYSLAKIYGEKQMFDQAAKEARECLRIDPLLHEAHFILAIAIVNKNHQEAEKHLKKYLELTQGRDTEASFREKAEELLKTIQKR